MGNTLNEQLDILEKIDYSKVINETTSTLKEHKIYINEDNVVKNIPEISFRIANKLSSLNFKDVLNIDFSKTIFSTLNVLNDEALNDSMQNLYSEINSLLSDTKVEPVDFTFLHNPTHYKLRKSHRVCAGIEYQFKDLVGTVCGMSSSNDSNYIKPLLREDTISYSYNNKDMDDEIENALIQYFTRDVDSEKDREYISRRLKNRELLVNKVCNFITTLRCGYLKRAIQGPIYLEFILDILTKSKDKFNEKEMNTFKELTNYINRFDMFEKVVVDALFYDKSLFLVEYDGSTIDLLHKFRIDDIYGFLPIVGIMPDVTSTVRDANREQGVELYGISLKRNGNVAKENVRSFDYNMNLLKNIVDSKQLPHNDDVLWLDPSKKYKLGNELIRGLLLEFFLLDLKNDDYDPSSVLKSRIDSYRNDFSLSNRKKIINSIESLYVSLSTHESEIKDMLNNFISLISKYINEDHSNHTKTITKKLSVLNMILPKDLDNIDRAELSSGDIQPSTTHLVKYTVLMDEELPKKHCVYSYEYTITLNSKAVFSSLDNSNISIKYGTNNFKQLSIAFLPRNAKNKGLTDYSDKVKNLMSLEMNSVLNRKNGTQGINYKNTSLFYIEYADIPFENDKFRYIYDLVFTMLSTVVSNILCEKASSFIYDLRNQGKEVKEDMSISNKLLYTNILQYTYQEANAKKDEFNKNQTVVRELRKSLAFALSEKHTANSQGFNMREIYNTSNALASMYSKLPRVCFLPSPLTTLDNLAIITVTSSCIDRAYLGRDVAEKVLLTGDVVTVKTLKDEKQVSISNYKTFIDYIDKNELHRNPNVLRDIVCELNNRGYKNILYVARTPYTSNMLEQEDKSQMYFMNESVLSEMSNGGDVSIFPLYMNYNKVQHDDTMLKPNENSFIYTSKVNTKENTYEGFEGIVPLIKLFTSSTAHFDSKQGINKDNYYSKIITYSSIKGIYSKDLISQINNEDILTNEYLQNDIKNILVMLHAVRNSKIPNTSNTLAIKGNPYEELIGNDSVSRLSTHNYYFNTDNPIPKKFATNRLGLVSYITKIYNK